MLRHHNAALNAMLPRNNTRERRTLHRKGVDRWVRHIHIRNVGGTPAKVATHAKTHCSKRVCLNTYRFVY